jgi:uncharacterized protein
LRVESLTRSVQYIHDTSTTRERIENMQQATQQYIYFLRLRPEYRDFSRWTEREEGIVHRHFDKLQKLTEDGIVILAGRTTTENPTGIVVFFAASEEEAETMMQEDPAVKEGLMEAELHPFRVALLTPRR